MNKIYTWGYSGSQPPDLKQYMEATGACLVDIRFSPRSRVAHWNRKALTKFVGEANYRWVPELGNENYNNDLPQKLACPHDALPLLRELLAERPVILLCTCRQWQHCHRDEASWFLGFQLGAPVEHLPGRYYKWIDRKEQHSEQSN